MEHCDASAKDGQTIEIEYDFTVEDYLTAVAESSMTPAHRPAIRRYRLRMLRESLTAVGGGAVLVALFLYFQIGAREPEIWFVFAGGLIFCVAGAFASVWPMKAAQRRYTQWHVRNASSSAGSRGFGRRTLIADSDQITIGTESASRLSTPWASVVGFEATPRYVYLRFGDGTGPILPRAAISEPDLIRLQQHCEKHAIGERATVEHITRLLAARDVLCPECQYSCRGIIDARCPECGRRIWQTDLHLADQTATKIADDTVSRASKRT